MVSRLFQESRDASNGCKCPWSTGEVYYTIARAQGFTETNKIMDRVKMLPLTILDADESMTTEAARLKAAHGLPYADCFAAAITGTRDILVTSDAKDFRKILSLHILALPEHKG